MTLAEKAGLFGMILGAPMLKEHPWAGLVVVMVGFSIFVFGRKQ